ncbi:13995_t:CDS:2, partial [Cetraspora pellucida]
MNEDYENISNKHQILESKATELQCLVDYINEELIANNLQHVDAIINNLNNAFTILSDIEQSKSQRVQCTTWHGTSDWLFCYDLQSRDCKFLVIILGCSDWSMSRYDLQCATVVTGLQHFDGDTG